MSNNYLKLKVTVLILAIVTILILAAELVKQ